MNYKNTKRTISKATRYLIQSMCKIIQPINNKSTVREADKRGAVDPRVC